MPSIITVSSTAFANNALIPTLHKSAFACGEANVSPYLTWTLGGDLNQQHIESFELLVSNTSLGNFKHWDVTNISSNQLFIGQASAWLAGVIIGTSDYGSGDATNGWNGPCASNGTDDVYTIRIRAIIKHTHIPFIGAEYIDSSLYTFKDNNLNISPPITTADCGTTNCAPGAALIESVCQTVTNEPVVISSIVYIAGLGSDNEAYGKYGTRFYADVDNYTFPLLGAPSVTPNSELIDSSIIPQALPFTVENTPGNLLWFNDLTLTLGRLNIAGIWTDGVGNASDGQWIGFSKCINVPITKKYCLGVAGDNRMRIKINGLTIAIFDEFALTHFNYWHIIELTLNKGANIIELEGYNDSGAAAFAAEIYDADINILQALTTEVSLEPYIFWSTRDQIGEDFDIGESTGYVCPDGTAYDSCTGGMCTSIIYTAPILTECCWLIENCKDDQDVYLIKLDAGETEPMYGNAVYEFAGNFAGPDAFINKCFILIGQEVCSIADVENVTVVTSYGTDNCVACEPSEKVESCNVPGSFEYLAMVIGQATMIVDRVYEFNTLNGCYTYVGQVTNQAPQKLDTIIITDYQTSNCLICIPCLQFRSCKSGLDIFIRLEIGQTEPSPNEVVLLSGNPALLDTCWQFVSNDQICDGNEDYLDVIIDTKYGCTTCEACASKYLITDCVDSTNTQIIEWEPLSPPLDESLIYIFDFAPDTCWKIGFLPPGGCEELPTVIQTPVIFNKACVVSFMDAIDWIACCVDIDTDPSLTSVIINGIEYVTGTIPTWNMPYLTAVDIYGLTTVTANNAFGVTYLEQVNGMNAAFAALGISHLVKIQVVKNDIWAGTEGIAPGPILVTHGGYYLITSDAVNSLSIIMNDDSGYSRTLTWTPTTISYTYATKENLNLGYEFVSCVDTNENPFVIINGTVQEEIF